MTYSHIQIYTMLTEGEHGKVDQLIKNGEFNPNEYIYNEDEYEGYYSELEGPVVHVAFFEGKYDIVKWLLDRGADLNVLDTEISIANLIIEDYEEYSESNLLNHYLDLLLYANNGRINDNVINNGVALFNLAFENNCSEAAILLFNRGVITLEDLLSSDVFINAAQENSELVTFLRGLYSGNHQALESIDHWLANLPAPIDQDSIHMEEDNGYVSDHVQHNHTSNNSVHFTHNVLGQNNDDSMRIFDFSDCEPYQFL